MMANRIMGRRRNSAHSLANERRVTVQTRHEAQYAVRQGWVPANWRILLLAPGVGQGSVITYSSRVAGVGQECRDSGALPSNIALLLSFNTARIFKRYRESDINQSQLHLPDQPLCTHLSKPDFATLLFPA